MYSKFYDRGSGERCSSRNRSWTRVWYSRTGGSSNGSRGCVGQQPQKMRQGSKIVQNQIKHHTSESELNSSGILELLKSQLGSHMIWSVIFRNIIRAVIGKMKLRRERSESQNAVRGFLHPILIRLWPPPLHPNCLTNDLYSGLFSMINSQSSLPLPWCTFFTWLPGHCALFVFFLLSLLSVISTLLFNLLMMEHSTQGTDLDSLSSL